MLLGVVPFALVTGVAMVASGIAPVAAILMSVLVFAGASMIASAQLLASGTPLVMVLLATAFINLRFMMYSATLRPHFGHMPLRWRLVVGYLVADNVVGLSAGRFADHREDPAKLEFFLGVGSLIWLAWQAGVAAGALLGAGLPGSWRLEFAAPLAFIAMSVPFIRDRATLAAALAAGLAVVLAHDLPLRLSIPVAALTGMAAGVWFSRKP
ncbi:MAG TPA: AzlC family ABC transporter permease [Burkholderiales bacterium]|nr:AzlC family ABC transporter permease [Burkholderiales bacterium]